MMYCKYINLDVDNCYNCPWFNKKFFRCDIMYIDEKPNLGGRLISWLRRRAAKAAASK